MCIFSKSIGLRIPRALCRRLRLWEDLQVFEDRVGELYPSLPSSAVEQLDLHPGPERFDDGVVEAITDEPIEGTTPESRARRVNAQEVNWVPWSEWISAPGEGLRFSIAMPRALVTREAVGDESIDQPTIRREKVSSTTEQ